MYRECLVHSNKIFICLVRLKRMYEKETYVWQSWIEIEYYSVAYFERITEFDML